MTLSYPSIFAIQAAVCLRLGVTTIDLQRRGSGGAKPRQLAMWLCRHCTLHSIPEIGRAFGGRDHTTVLHALQRVESYLRSDRQLAEAAILLRHMLTPREAVA